MSEHVEALGLDNVLLNRIDSAEDGGSYEERQVIYEEARASVEKTILNERARGEVVDEVLYRDQMERAIERVEARFYGPAELPPSRMPVQTTNSSAPVKWFVIGIGILVVMAMAFTWLSVRDVPEAVPVDVSSISDVAPDVAVEVPPPAAVDIPPPAFADAKAERLEQPETIQPPAPPAEPRVDLDEVFSERSEDDPVEPVPSLDELRERLQEERVADTGSPYGDFEVGPIILVGAEGDADSTVSWTQAQLPPVGEAAPENAIEAEVDVSSQGVEIDILLRRNADPEIPASHVVEVVFDGSRAIDGQDVVSIGALRVRDTFDDIGRTLVAVSARIAPDRYVIALNGNAPYAAENVAAIESAEYLEIPLVLENETVRPLVVRKGVEGTDVVRRILSAWSAAL